MRAKPKRQTSTAWHPVEPVPFSSEQGKRLLEDLELDRTDGEAVLRDLYAAVGEYRAAIEFFKSYPRPAHQLAELRRLAPKLKAAYLDLRALSVPTRQRVKNARAEAKADAGIPIRPEDVEHAQQIDRAVDRAHADLVDLYLASSQAIKNFPSERRGRLASTVHALIRQLAMLFATHDQATHDSETERINARNAFIRHVLKFANIPAPKRLAFALRNN